MNKHYDVLTRDTFVIGYVFAPDKSFSDKIYFHRIADDNTIT